MMSSKSKLIVIVGPTSSGKSELAVRIAKKFNGEIVSADSRQVYRNLDIGTGKVSGKWQPKTKSQKSKVKSVTQNSKVFVYRTVPHYCIDFVSPKRVFTVAEYKRCAESAITSILERGKTPVIAGGTGFYVDAVVNDLSLPEVPPDQALRERLAKKSAAELFSMLKKLDPRRAKGIDASNPRRLIRAIEIAKTFGRVPELKRHSRFDVLWLGIAPSEKMLRRRIHNRLYQRMRQGMVAEARGLKHRGLSWNRFDQLGLEYRFLADYLRGRISKKDMLLLLEKAISDYARRQMTWFRKNREIHWTRSGKEAETAVAKFFSRSSAPLEVVRVLMNKRNEFL